MRQPLFSESVVRAQFGVLAREAKLQDRVNNIVLVLAAMLVIGTIAAGCRLLSPQTEIVTRSTWTATAVSTDSTETVPGLTPLATPTATPTPPDPTATPWQMVISALVAANVRAGPTEEAEVIARLPRGTRVQVVEVKDEWRRVTVEGLEGSGWVHEAVLASYSSDSHSAAPGPRGTRNTLADGRCGSR